MPTIPECELPSIRVEEPRTEARGSESWMDVDIDDDDDDMPPLVEKPPGHDAHSGPDEEEDDEDNLPEISVASYSTLPSGGFTFIADGSESSAAGTVSTTSFQMPGTLSIHHTPAGPATSSQHEFSFSINNNTSHSSSNSVSPLPSPMTDVAGEFANTITNDIASAPRGRTKHHLISDPDESYGNGEGEGGGVGGYIPRPPNAFILFRSSFIRSQKISGKVEGNHSTLSKIIGMYWRTLPAAERAEWEAKARIAQDEHRRRYPDWRFRPGSSKNTGQRGRGRKGKGGTRKGRLKTKDGGEEDNPADPDERMVHALNNTSLVVDKGKGRERNTVDVRGTGKGKGRDIAESDASPQKISILIPQVPPLSKKPYHLRDRPSKFSNTSSPFFNDNYPVQPAETSLSATPLTSVPSKPPAFAHSYAKSSAPGIPTSEVGLPLSNTAASTSVSAATSDAKAQPRPTREDLRIKHITQLLVAGKEGVELERELERWDRGEKDPEIHGPNSSDTERGGTPLPPWSPEAPRESATPASERYPNTPSSASTTSTDPHTHVVSSKLPSDLTAQQNSPELDSNQLQVQLPADEERMSNGKKRSSSAPAPGSRVPYSTQNTSGPYLPDPSGHDSSEHIAAVDTRETEYDSRLQTGSSTSTWDDPYDDYFIGYEHRPQQSSSPFPSSPLSPGDGDHFQHHDQNQRQWTYPPYPAAQPVAPATDHNLQQYTQTSLSPSRNTHRHTRTRSHLHPIQSFPSEGQAMLSPPNTPASHPPQDQMMLSPTPSDLSPITPSSAPPGYGEGTRIPAERNINMPRRGSIAFPITPSSRSSIPSPGSLSNHKSSAWEANLDGRNQHGDGDDGNSQTLNWETVEAQRREWFQTEAAEIETRQQSRYELAYRNEREEPIYPSPDTRNMGWITSQHQLQSFQPFSPSDESGPSGMNWEQADEGRQGLVACIVDPYLLGSREREEETDNVASDPPPTSNYSSLSGWAGEPVVRLPPPNYYDRKDSQSSVWEVDDEVGFGFGIGFGRRSG
ncbi:hypothetical protein L218DRAFT_1072505 [Marasmius fiardii PR-910]|nr:hypothetical protein L218DRAFT_1072505 [Marasmius fiardii PR-910]